MRYETGLILGGYRLTRQCGTGAYGQVFLADNVLSGQTVALKIIAKTGHGWERELSALTRYKGCQHPNLLQIYHLDQTDDAIYYTMECADNLDDGQNYLPDTLANRIHRQKHLDSKELLPVVNQLLDALEFLHRKKLIHRDVKPDNILFIRGRTVLADIGLVNELGEASFAGTIGFMSDEVISGNRKAAPGDDFYALGKVIYCALTGMDVKHYPDFNDSMTLSFHRGLIAVMLRTCRKPYISKAATLRKMLQSDGREVYQGRLPSRSLLLLVIFWGICGFALYHIFMAGKQPSVKFRAAEVKETETPKVTVPRQTPETTPPETKITETAPPQVEITQTTVAEKVSQSAKAAETAPQALPEPAIVIPVVTPEAPKAWTNSPPPPVTKIQSQPKYSSLPQAELPPVDWQSKMIEAIKKADLTGFNQARLHINSLDFRDQAGSSLLKLAMDANCSSIVELLIRDGANINEVVDGVPLISYVISQKKHGMLLVLINSKADINQPDTEGRVPLLYAILAENERALRALLFAKANPNATDKNGNTLLSYTPKDSRAAMDLKHWGAKAPIESKPKTLSAYPRNKQ